MARTRLPKRLQSKTPISPSTATRHHPHNREHRSASMAMRVLMLSWEYPPYVVGGLGVHVGALAPALARQGVAVTVVTPRWQGGDRTGTFDGVGRVYRVDPPVDHITNLIADV